jgi:aspartate-semialdehyde dehydrogenase
VRRLPALRNGLSLFACGDNLRKGNALNAVQVAERVLGLGREL